MRSIKDRLKEIHICRAIRRSGLFDPEHYLRNNLDVARSCMDPIKHYIRHGWREGRNLSEFFDTKWYLKTYPDVEKASINPLYDCYRHGLAEGRFSSGGSKEDIVTNKISKNSKPRPETIIIASDFNEIVEHSKVHLHDLHKPNPPWKYRLSEAELLHLVRQYNSQKTKRKAKVAVYTAIIGGYDQLKLPEYISNDWDYVCFSDMDIPGEHIFEIRKPDYYSIDPVRMARYIKLHPHFYFPEYEYAVWIDASILIRGPHLQRSVEYCRKNNILFMCNPHPYRNCVYEELAKATDSALDDKEVMERQIAGYRSEGFPSNCGMLETGILIRKHNDRRIRVLNETWWDEIEKGSHRDQLSVMYVLWKQQLPFRILPNMKNVREHEANDYCLFLHGGKADYYIPPYIQPCFMNKCVLSKENTRRMFSEHDLASLRNHRIDIVICVHNALDDVKKCLESVLAAHLSSHRIIVVDDGSDADTQAMLRTFIEKYPQQIKLIRNEKAQGYTKAANMGLRASDAPFVILLNSDTIVPQHWALKLLQTARKNPYIGIVGPMSNAASWQSLPLVKDPATGRLAVNELPCGKSIQDMDRLCEEKSDYPVFPLVGLVNGFCYGIKREVLEAIGYFDEVAFPKGYGEEDDYSFRALDAGFIHAIATHCYVYHAKSKSYDDKERNHLTQAGRKTLRSRYGEERIQRASQSMKNNPLIQKVRLRVSTACGFYMEEIFSDKDSEIIKTTTLKQCINRAIEIYQVVFSDEQVGKVTSPFIEYDIRNDNSRSEWHEYWNFLRLYQTQREKEDRYWGVVSFKFSEKTGLSPWAFYKFIEDNLGYDVYFVNPYEYLTYAYGNPWHQGEIWHPGLIQIVQTIMDRLNYGIDVNKLKIPGSLVAYCNYFVGNAFFWDRYIDFTKPIFDYIENCPDKQLLKIINQRAYKTRPCSFRPFIMERMLSTFLAIQGNRIQSLKYPYNIEHVLKEACLSFRRLAGGYNKLYKKVEVYENKYNSENKNIQKVPK